MRVVESDAQIECYRFTAQAIGLMEMLGNRYPNSKQIDIAEKIVRNLQLSWNACESPKALIKELGFSK